MKHKAKYIRWFEEIGIENVPLVGGKNASLGEMYVSLALKELKFPMDLRLPPRRDNLHISATSHVGILLP